MIDRLFSVEGKNVLVTGGTRGIGEMIARGFAESGANVMVSSRSADACKQTADDLGCKALPADLSSDAGCVELADWVAAEVDELHVLVNNAGNAWGEAFETFPMHAFDRVWDLNVKAIFRMTQLLHPQLKAAATPDDPARVINIGSIDGIRVPQTPNYSYSASKAAVHQLTRHIAKELAGQHINVNAIAPGLFPSKMTKFLFESDLADEFINHGIPVGRAGKPEDMAGTAIYLASRASAFVTGSVVVVDGGSGNLAQ